MILKIIGILCAILGMCIGGLILGTLFGIWVLGPPVTLHSIEYSFIVSLVLGTGVSLCVFGFAYMNQIG